MTPLLPGITHLGQCKFLSLGEVVPGLLPRLLLLDLLKVAHLDEPARLLLLNDQANRLGSPALSRQGNAVGATRKRPLGDGRRYRRYF